MPLISKKWTELSDENRAIFSLLESFELIIMNIGSLFEPYAVPVY
jgi:hypothetical protein